MTGRSDSTYQILMGLLEARTGQAVSPGRIWRIEMALKPVLHQHKIEDLDQLVSALVKRTDSTLLNDVIDAMLNNETYFFREHQLFEKVATGALEELRRVNASTRKLTVWHCGVSTGQEAYSLAMQLAEDGDRWADWQIEIVGTDVSSRAIARAQTGIYSQFEIQRGLPAQRMVRWFDQTDSGWLAKADLRRRVEFSVQNLLVDRPPLQRPADLVFCRNVLLYFSPETRHKAFIRLRTFATRDSFLVLGAGETVLGQTDQYVSSRRIRGLYEPADATVQIAARRA